MSAKVAPDVTHDAVRPLAGQVALVTGGASGLGRCHALTLAAAGAAVAVCDLGDKHTDVDNGYALSDRSRLERTVAELQAAGHSAIAVQADIRDEEDLTRGVAQVVDELGRLDVLVANAGIALWRETWATTRPEWDRILAVNLTGTWQSCKAVIPVMREQQYGRIVLIASVSGLKASPGFGAYAASKAGVISIGKSLARELGDDGITVNTVCPSTVDAGASRGAAFTGDTAWEDFRANLTSRQVLKELVKPEDVSRAVLFFATPAARLMTGTCLPVDAGQTIV